MLLNRLTDGAAEASCWTKSSSLSYSRPTAQWKQVVGRNPPHCLIPARCDWSQYGDGRGKIPRSCFYVSNAQPRNDRDICLLRGRGYKVRKYRRKHSAFLVGLFGICRDDTFSGPAIVVASSSQNLLDLDPACCQISSPLHIPLHGLDQVTHAHTFSQQRCFDQPRFRSMLRPALRRRGGAFAPPAALLRPALRRRVRSSSGAVRPTAWLWH